MLDEAEPSLAICKWQIVTDLRPVEHVISERLPYCDPSRLVLEADPLMSVSSGPLAPQPVVGVALGAPASAAAAAAGGGAA